MGIELAKRPPKSVGCLNYRFVLGVVDLLWCVGVSVRSMGFGLGLLLEGTEGYARGFRTPSKRNHL